MQAVIQDRYGHPDVLRLGVLPEPVPADDQVLLHVRAVSLNGSDRENLAGCPAYARWSNGLRRPRHPVPGSDVAGVVAAVGRAVTEYVVGDELFGELAGYLGGLADLGRAGGVFVVALAEHAGAEVPAVDRADKADFLHEIGTDRTIDLATEDWADERGNFDLIVDLVAHRSPFRVHGALRRGG
ncbi:MAG TPA: alcohol dehydrogenase catalytic domain-containing protein, partial [Ornithinibacter sp.]|nr:alcohol dehydrogenase catalytic domain-containing protein [Ornithinibacter sp.]